MARWSVSESAANSNEERVNNALSARRKPLRSALTRRRRALRNRRATTWRGIASVYARAERKTKESRTLTVQHGRRGEGERAERGAESASRWRRTSAADRFPIWSKSKQRQAAVVERNSKVNSQSSPSSKAR